MLAPDADSTAAPVVPPPVAILEMLAGRWVSAAVAVAARLDLADALASGPRTSTEIAAGRDLHAPSLYRLLRALASLGIVTEEHDERFALTELGQFLRSDVPGTMRGMARWFASEEHGAAWNALAYSVRSGDAAFDHVYGRSFWSFLEDEPVLSATFAEAKNSALSSMRQEIAAVLPLDGAPGDVQVLSWVLHERSDSECVRILRSCCNALEPGGRIVIVEFVIERGEDEELANLLDLEMLVMTSAGRERTRRDFEAIFIRTGLRLDRITRLPSGPCVLEMILT
jgi:O-methyltransferase domain/Dimerisation domain